MLAGAEDLDDDLSDEGRQNLDNYLAWAAAQRKKQQHHEIMEKFGGMEVFLFHERMSHQRSKPCMQVGLYSTVTRERNQKSHCKEPCR